MNDTQIGWLSPEGKLIPCESYEHIAIAFDLIEEYNYPNPSRIPVDDVLLQHQWVHITFSSFFDFGYNIFWEGRLTPECYSYLKNLFEDPEMNIVRSSRMIWEEYNDIYQ